MNQRPPISQTTRRTSVRPPRACADWLEEIPALTCRIPSCPCCPAALGLIPRQMHVPRGMASSGKQFAPGGHRPRQKVCGGSRVPPTPDLEGANATRPHDGCGCAGGVHTVRLGRFDSGERKQSCKGTRCCGGASCNVSGTPTSSPRRSASGRPVSRHTHRDNMTWTRRDVHRQKQNLPTVSSTICLTEKFIQARRHAARP